MADVGMVKHGQRVRIEALTKKGALILVEYYDPHVILDVPGDVAQEVKETLIKRGVEISEHP